MMKLPVIVGFGGINSAGLSSGHLGYRRLVYDAISAKDQARVLQSLAVLSGNLKLEAGAWQDPVHSAVDLPQYLEANESKLLSNSLIRQLGDTLFDPAALPYHHRLSMQPASGPVEFSVPHRRLPQPLPASWQQIDADDEGVTFRVQQGLDVLLPCQLQSPVNVAGQLPGGFDPAAYYQSRNHPRGLQLTVFGASDAIHSLGMDWETVRGLVPADKIAVYAGSGLGQLDYNGFGGLLQARLHGKKVSSKQLALGYAEMPADFINAYLLGSLGTTGTNVAACATFLYNLRQGIRDIQSGSHRVAIIGTSEAPLTPEVFEGFTNMGALADDESLRQLDKLPSGASPDYRRACRPFANNTGFTLAESAQFVVLFDDELALHTGANIYGAVNDVFINADGFKKSISSPGLGNYLTLARAAAATRNIIGERGLREHSFVQAHGTGTPQNRVTESAIIDEVASAFGINGWPVTAIKSYLGHSLASSAGDQVVATLGVWQDGILPAIQGVDSLADDVSHDNIDFLLSHTQPEQPLQAAIVNSKGFGGNNASASLLSPGVTRDMLARRHGQAALTAHARAHEDVARQTEDYLQACLQGENRVIYHFDQGVLGANDLALSATSATIQGQNLPVDLDLPNPYPDMCGEQGTGDQETPG